MTYFYYKTSTTNDSQVVEANKKQWEHLANKKNWRITQLPNGYYQAECVDPCDCDPNKEECDCRYTGVTRRETVESCEAAIDASIDHYQKRLDFLKGPKVIKTF